MRLSFSVASLSVALSSARRRGLVMVILAIMTGGAVAQSPAVTAAPGGVLVTGDALGRLAPGSAEVQKAFNDACTSGARDVAAKALSLGADPDDPVSPLTLAAGHNDAELASLLIEYGADASLAPGALEAALRHKNAALASLLLNAGADPNLPDAKGITPLAAALKAGDIDLARVMFRHGGYPDEFIEPALKQGDTALLGTLFQYGIRPDRADAAGNPLLVRAALENKPEFVAFLLKSGANPGLTGKDGLSALHMAMLAKQEPLMRALLEGGADPNQPFTHPVKPEVLERVDDPSFKKWLKRDTGLTPLMLAAARGDTETISLLLEKGARRGLQTKGWKRFPVVFACDGEHIAAAKLLLGRKPNPEEVEHRVTINLTTQRAVLYKNDEPVRSCRVSTGRKGYATPTGRYVITDKQKEWTSTIYKVSMPYFMRLNCREIGMHAGVCPGYPASHGCIRMPHADVRHLFSLLKIGDAVTIEY
jgi:ankyrin repeat protein